MKPAFKLLLLFAVVLSGCAKDDHPSLKSLYNDYRAQQEVKNEKYEEALTQYYQLLEDDGNRAGTHSNIGVILNSIQRPEDALKSLQHALKLAQAAGDSEMLFKIHYNLGVYFGAQKNIAQALENYQTALDLVPSSHEIKTNIELLMQQQNQEQKNGKGEQSQNKQSGQGQGEDEEKKQGEQKQDQGDENKEPDDGQDKKNDAKKEGSPKYQPRPFKGEQLSEGDVKKILGELKNQEQKIRANFDKKEKQKGKSQNNEKNW